MHLERFVIVVQVGVVDGNISQQRREAILISLLPEHRHHLRLELNCFLVFVQLCVSSTDVIDGQALAFAIVETLIKRARLLKEIQRLLVIAYAAVKAAETTKGRGLTGEIL